MKKLKHISTNIVSGYIIYMIYINRTLMDGDWNKFLNLSDAVKYLLDNFKPQKGIEYAIVESSPRLSYIYK